MLWRSPFGRARSRAPQDGDPPGVPRRPAQKHVGRHTLGRSSGFVEQTCRGQVARVAVAGQEVLVDRRFDDRVHEAQVPRRCDDVGFDEQVSGAPCGIRLQAGNVCREAEVAGVAQHRGGARQLDRGGPKSLEATNDEPAHGGRPNLRDPRRCVGGRREPGVLDGTHELSEEQGVAAGGPVARGHESLVGLRPELAREHVSNRSRSGP
jgi:hypothetical protein